MKSALQVFSWVAVVIGSLAIISGLASTDANGQYYVDGLAVLGGALFFTQGLLSIIYISKEK